MTKKKAKGKKYTIIIMLIFIMVFGLMGCGQSVKDVSDTTKVATGSEVKKVQIYKKNAIEVPEGENPMFIAAGENGTLYVIAENDKRALSLWQTSDDENWENKGAINDLLGIKGSSYSYACVSPKGEIFAAYNDSIDQSDEFKISCSDMNYCYIDESGNKKDINLNMMPVSGAYKRWLAEYYEKDGDFVNEVANVRFAGDKIYVLDASSNIYEVDKSNGTSKCVYKGSENSYIDDFNVCDGALLIVKMESLEYISLESGTDDKKIKEKIDSFFQEASENNIYINIDVADNKFWVMAQDKISCINLDNDEKKFVKATGYSQLEYAMQQAVSGDDVYVLTTKTDGSDKKSIYKYTLGTVENEVMGSGKLKIWKLDEGYSIEPAIRVFTDQHPEIEVEVEIGIDNAASGITEADAIKNLNAEILAGNGPDIIYMDGLPIDKYIESGKLCDLSEAVNKLEESGNYFNNMLEAFNRDGKIYVVPSDFTTIEKIGTEETLKISENVLDFANFITENEENKKIFPNEIVADYLIYMYYKDLQKNLLEGKVDRAQIEDYFDAAKKLYDNTPSGVNPLDALYFYWAPNYAINYEGDFSFSIGRSYDLSFKEEYSEQMAKDIGGKVEYPANDFKDKFIVQRCIAISDTSANKELAKEYMLAALGKESQMEFRFVNAFVVNKDAFVDNAQFLWDIRNMNGTVTDASVDITKKVQEFMGLVDNMTQPISINYELDNIVFSAVNEYVGGDKSRQEAIDSLIEKVNIYISE